MNVVLLWPAAGNRHHRWATSYTIVGLRTVILEKPGGKIQMLKAVAVHPVAPQCPQN